MYGSRNLQPAVNDHRTHAKASQRLLELRHEVLMELDEAIRPLSARRQESCSKMQGSFFLAEA